MGRAARHLNGRAIMYADTITESMEKTMSETQRRREIQMKYNEEHGIVPHRIVRDRNVANLIQAQQAAENRAYIEREPAIERVAEQDYASMDKEELRRCVKVTTDKMREAAKRMDFVEAALLRDEMLRMQALL